MTALTFRSPVTKPLLRAGTSKPVPPDPAAYDTFRVTQAFGARDFYYADGRVHGAVDVGNFRCGDPVVAMCAGTARRVKDNARSLGAKSDALGVVVDHGYGITSECWHLNRQDVADGQRVAAGQQIGVVGRTGLGDVCHLHVEVKRNGTRIDPEPLMFGGSLTVEDDMQIRGANLRHIQNRSARLAVKARFRSSPETTDNVIDDLEAGALIFPIAVVTGQSVGTAPDATDWYYGIKTAGVVGSQLGCVHSSVLPRLPDGRGVALTPIETADCSAQDAEVRRLSTKIARARTANAGARQASEAVEVALR